MATGKRYFWMKLRKDFMSGEVIDYLMSCDPRYVVFYEMLCMSCLDTAGKLQSKIGNKIVPFDTAKIQRETRYFDADTVNNALQLFKELGLLYEDEEGILTIDNYSSLVGHETDYAQQKREQRQRNAIVDMDVDNVHTDNRIKISESRVKISEHKEKESSSSIETRPREKDAPDDDQCSLLNKLNNVKWLEGVTDRVLEYRSKLSDELIMHGLDRALEYGGHSMKYLCIILDGFVDNGYTTVEQAEADEEHRKQSKINGHYKPYRGLLGEVVV